MAGKFTFTLKEYQEAAVKYRADLLMLPIIGIGDTLQYMTGRPGIRYKERVGNLTGDAQFAPYNPQRAVDYNLSIEFRDLETYFGSVVANFEPNSAISTLLGTGATKGDGQMTTPTARHVLARIAKNLSEHLNDAVWNGRRNAAGDTTADLFDGFDTITEKEIAAGAIAADEGNYMKFTDAITPANAVDIAKEILFSLDPRLRSLSLENSTCPDSERYPFLKELIALDKKLHANWEAYDHYVAPGPDAAPSRSPKGKRSAAGSKKKKAAS